MCATHHPYLKGMKKILPIPKSSNLKFTQQDAKIKNKKKIVIIKAMIDTRS